MTHSSSYLPIVAAATLTVGCYCTALWFNGCTTTTATRKPGGKQEAEQDYDYRQRSSTEVRSRFRTRKTKRTRIICSPSNGETHSCLKAFVRPTDVVLLVRGTKVVEDEEQIRSLASKVILFEGSVWDLAKQQQQQQHGKTGVDFIFMDPSNIHGNAIFFDSVVLIRLLRAMFEPRTILVKSRLLAKHARSYMTLPQLEVEASSATKAANGQDEKSAKLMVVHPQRNDVPPTRVVCTVGVSDYRATIPHLVKSDDHILEIGCHFGTTTFLLAQAASEGHSVGIDVGKVCIERAKQLYQKPGKPQNVSFAQGDAWDTRALLGLDQEGFDVIYVDVGGISGSDGELEGMALVRQLQCAFDGRGGQSSKRRLRAIVVKSRCLRDHANRWSHSDDIRRGVAKSPLS